MAAESEPQLGSVIAMAPQMGLSPSWKRARNFSFCSSVPAAATAAPPRPDAGVAPGHHLDRDGAEDVADTGLLRSVRILRLLALLAAARELRRGRAAVH